MILLIWDEKGVDILHVLHELSAARHELGVRQNDHVGRGYTLTPPVIPQGEE